MHPTNLVFPDMRFVVPAGGHRQLEADVQYDEQVGGSAHVSVRQHRHRKLRAHDAERKCESVQPRLAL